MDGHAHGTSHAPLIDPRSGSRTVEWTLWTVGLVGAAILVGLVVLWPRGEVESVATTEGLRYPEATVVAVDRDTCTSVEAPGPLECQLVTLDLTSGPDAGARVTMQVAAIDFQVPDLEVGDELVVQHNPLAPAEFAFTFWEFQRQAPLTLLVVLFVVVVVAFGRWQGVRALSGLVVSLGVILLFLLPALLRDEPAVPVALVTAGVVAFATLYLAHGVSLETTVALIGTLLSLLLITVLAAVFVAVTHLTGLSGEDVQLLRVTTEAFDPVGILLAGIIIGALGVLDDVTVTQVAAVAELRAAGAAMTSRELYRRALRVGRDHIAATVNTLVLAYVGASLSLLLFVVQSERGFVETATREIVSIEIVRTLVGSIGLVAAVPVTTALAVAISQRGPAPERVVDPPDDTVDVPSGPRWEDFGPESP